MQPGNRSTRATPTSTSVTQSSRSRALLPLPAFAALVAAVVAVLVIAVLSYRSLAARAEAADAVNHTNEVQDHLHRFLSEIKDAETGQRGFLLTGSDAYLEPYEKARTMMPVELAGLQHLIADNAAQQAQLEQAKALMRDKL